MSVEAFIVLFYAYWAVNIAVLAWAGETAKTRRCVRESIVVWLVAFVAFLLLANGRRWLDEWPVFKDMSFVSRVRANAVRWAFIDFAMGLVVAYKLRWLGSWAVAFDALLWRDRERVQRDFEEFNEPYWVVAQIVACAFLLVGAGVAVRTILRAF